MCLVEVSKQGLSDGLLFTAVIVMAVLIVFLIDKRGRK